MGFFSKLFGGSTDTATEVVNDVKEVAAEKVEDAVETVKEGVEEKKDSCCGGNCGS